MRLRTKLILTWGGLMVLLWAATLWPIQRTIASNFARIADEGFTGTRRNLEAVQAERLKQMRQACWLVMNIPELRALIAEDNYELSEINLASLVERLDGLTDMVGVNFVCVLDNSGRVIAQNRRSPWPTLDDLNGFLSGSSESIALVRRVFASTDPNGAAEGDLATSGLWADDGRLYEAVGVPLIFGGDPTDPVPHVDGALVMATMVTDDLTIELGKNHNCEISFLAGRSVAASSLPRDLCDEIEGGCRTERWASGEAFETNLQGVAYRTWLEPLKDPSSNQPVGAMLVQSSLTHAQAAQARVSRVMFAILAGGLLAVALASYLLSGAVTRPLADLVGGVRQVAAGDLDLALRTDRGGEVGELASAFNDMVNQMRARRELQRLVEESQAASRAKSRFLANMSHEIRTPLNGVVGMAQLLLATGLDDRQRRYAGLVKSSAEVLTGLINDILDFSKIEAGKMELESIAFSPGAVIEEVAEMLAPKAHQKGLEIICDVEQDVPVSAVGDPIRVRQVLMNLVINAIKFTESGEIIVRASCDSGGEERALVRFLVSDTGIGIPPDRRDRLFQSFSQVDASTTRKYGGTGLGLAISKQLAELMGGSIGVESEPGRGSAFWFTAALGVAPTSTPVGRIEARGVRAIIADPNAASRDVLARRCRDLGMDVKTVAGGEQAVAALEAAAPTDARHALVLLAREACHMDMAALAATLRSTANSASMRLFLMVKSDHDLDAPALKKAGFAGHLTKPIRQSSLNEAIAAVASGGPIGQECDPLSSGPSKAPTRRKARILLAEDHEVNQLVVTEMLANAGYACDVVSDGRKAVEAAASAKHDLILMDCQMPEMDGFEATGAIRARERASGRTAGIPIIAITANAIGGDRQKCLDVGMNGYCSKPIDATRLIEAVESLLSADAKQPIAGGQSLAEASTIAPSADAEASVPAATRFPFDYAALLRRCSGKTDLAERVLHTLTTQFAQTLKELESRLGEDDAAGVAREAHGLKGAAGMAGADALREAAARLEALGKAGDLASAHDGLAALREEIRRCDSFICGAVRPAAAATETGGVGKPMPANVKEASHADPDRR